MRYFLELHIDEDHKYCLQLISYDIDSVDGIERVESEIDLKVLKKMLEEID